MLIFQIQKKTFSIIVHSPLYIIEKSKTKLPPLSKKKMQIVQPLHNQRSDSCILHCFLDMHLHIANFFFWAVPQLIFNLPLSRSCNILSYQTSFFFLLCLFFEITSGYKQSRHLTSKSPSQSHKHNVFKANNQHSQSSSSISQA